MNRTDRLYALVEELRAVSPRPRSARWLGSRFEVSQRTIERDIAALQQAGTPIYAEPGRSGGYTLDRASSLPPLNLTPYEATAIAAGLRSLTGTPFAAAGRVALRKVLAVMAAKDLADTKELAARVQVLVPAAAPPQVPGAIQEAFARREVLLLDYGDRHGKASQRLVEPLGFLAAAQWYLLAWCRLRKAVRGFRLDRIRAVTSTGESMPPRQVDLSAVDTLGYELRPLDVTAITDTTLS